MAKLILREPQDERFQNTARGEALEPRVDEGWSFSTLLTDYAVLAQGLDPRGVVAERREDGVRVRAKDGRR